eukprot:Lithocolla_globosa_v1_NODE_1469_length_2548_cov_94.431207.p1 type:complete len:119 gc:universal NODE_1469_length_2548_cov_94.431207:2010-2366(+)
MFWCMIARVVGNPSFTSCRLCITKANNRTTVVVICPTIALMEDQAENKGLKAETVHSESDNSLSLLMMAENDLIFISPELANTPEAFKLFGECIQLNMIGFFVFDEAHLIAEWGLTFR